MNYRVYNQAKHKSRRAKQYERDLADKEPQSKECSKHQKNKKRAQELRQGDYYDRL